MSAEVNKSVVRRYMEEGVNQANVVTAGELLAAGFKFHFPGVPVPLDQEGWKQTTIAFHSAFPDEYTTIDDLFAEGDRVAARFTFHGTQTGDFQGIPPTHKTVTFGGQAIWRLADGKIAEHWVQLDAMGMMQQLGVIPAPAPAR